MRHGMFRDAHMTCTEELTRLTEPVSSVTGTTLNILGVLWCSRLSAREAGYDRFNVYQAPALPVPS